MSYQYFPRNPTDRWSDAIALATWRLLSDSGHDESLRRAVNAARTLVARGRIAPTELGARIQDDLEDPVGNYVIEAGRCNCGHDDGEAHCKHQYGLSLLEIARGIFEDLMAMIDLGEGTLQPVAMEAPLSVNLHIPFKGTSIQVTMRDTGGGKVPSTVVAGTLVQQAQDLWEKFATGDVAPQAEAPPAPPAPPFAPPPSAAPAPPAVPAPPPPANGAAPPPPAAEQPPDCYYHPGKPMAPSVHKGVKWYCKQGGKGNYCKYEIMEDGNSRMAP